MFKKTRKNDVEGFIKFLLSVLYGIVHVCAFNNNSKNYDEFLNSWFYNGNLKCVSLGNTIIAFF